MLISKEVYDKIPSNPSGFFMNFPGVYCICGEVFALYSYSAIPPHGLDMNGKPFYNKCFMCVKDIGNAMDKKAP